MYIFSCCIFLQSQYAFILGISHARHSPLEFTVNSSVPHRAKFSNPLETQRVNGFIPHRAASSCLISFFHDPKKGATRSDLYRGALVYMLIVA